MFDPKDPFDAAALYDMWFNCSDCDRILSCEPQLPIGLEYYHELGQMARQQGWRVTKVGTTQHEDPQYQVLCPHCAARQGSMPSQERDGLVPQGILDLCRSLKDAA